MSNPLIAQTHDTDKALAGTGVVNDVVSFSNNLTGDAGALSTAVSGVATGLGLLGAAMSPLSTLASAGIGWLIEHIEFLEDALEALTGDPEAITAQAQTWRNIAKQVRDSAGQYDNQAKTVLTTWNGHGAAGYSATSGAFGQSLHATADGAEGAASAIEQAGMLVGVERGLIRDLISEFSGWMIVEAGIALASSWCTFGASIAVFTGFAVGQAVKLGSTIANKLSALATKLDDLSQLVSKMSGSFDQLAGGIKQLGTKVDNAATSLSTKVDNAATMPANAQQRVDDFFKNTQPQAQQFRDKLGQARDGNLGIHQKVSEPVKNLNIPGTGKTINDALETNVLDGQNYVRSRNLETGERVTPIKQDHTWSMGDTVKSTAGTVKGVTSELSEPEDSTDQETEPPPPEGTTYV